MSTTGRNVFLVVTVITVLTLVTLNHYTGLITDDHSHVTLLQKIETHQHPGQTMLTLSYSSQVVIIYISNISVSNDI